MHQVSDRAAPLMGWVLICRSPREWNMHAMDASACICIHLPEYMHLRVYIYKCMHRICMQACHACIYACPMPCAPPHHTHNSAVHPMCPSSVHPSSDRGGGTAKMSNQPMGGAGRT